MGNSKRVGKSRLDLMEAISKILIKKSEMYLWSISFAFKRYEIPFDMTKTSHKKLTGYLSRVMVG